MVVEYHYGANILLDYWHRLNKGKQPFTLSLPIRDVVRSVNLDEKEERFVDVTRRHVEAKGNLSRSMIRWLSAHACPRGPFQDDT
jgi:hypothetical protein